MLKNIILTVGVSALLSSCATLISGTSQSVKFQVIDSENHILDGAKCTITDGDGGMYAVYMNPGTVKIKRTDGLLTVKCTKAGYKQSNVSVGNSFNKTTLVNILWWPGFIVDGFSGAYTKYPSHYTIMMEKESN